MKRHFICALIALMFSLSLALSSVTVAETDTWTKKADMPIAWAYSFASAVSGKIYAIGGMNLSGDLSTVEEYDTGFSGEGVEAKEKLATKWGKLKGDEK